MLHSSPSPRRPRWALRPAILALASVTACGLGMPCPAPAADVPFRRGDSNADGKLDLSDALKTFGFLFLGFERPGCMDAADANDSGVVDLSDGVYSLSFLFLGTKAPPAPGHLACGADPTQDSISCVAFEPCRTTPSLTELQQAGHLLNRIGYGPSEESLQHVRQVGLEAYIEEQLHPESIDESGNTELASREATLFTLVEPRRDRRLVAAGDLWSYAKGTSEPPADWKSLGFDDSQWLAGITGIGYGGSDDATVLADMQGNYLSVYLRKNFSVADLAAVQSLIFKVDYDDGFVAYLNGTEVARRGLTGNPPPFNAKSTRHDPGAPEEIDISSKKGLLAAGANVLAVQVHNYDIGSGDLTMIPELIDREMLPGPPVKTIRGFPELQQLIHIRGIYSRKQLQAVLAEFWENHFTTDGDKFQEYLDALQKSDASDAMNAAQAKAEAAQAEYLEHQFFYENALGNFGDLLLYSATSPTMLVYLDNVLNVKGAANENYAREIFELFGFGVDNRYKQEDIEQLAKCFTGWTACKVLREEAQPFPASATNPPTECGVLFSDTVLLDLGAGWKYLRGTAEPSPDPGDGAPTTEWTGLDFPDETWLSGSTGIGYGDGDDATVLSDMRGSYASVYLRRRFTVAGPGAIRNLILDAAYDDGFVAYLNGVEVARSYSMRSNGKPPAFNALAGDQREASAGSQSFSLNPFKSLLAAGENVLAIQVHNVALDSSDLSMLPRLLDREILPGSVENGDPDGTWVFRFDPAKHDTSAKTLFKGTPYEINVPAGRSGAGGLQDALQVVQGMVDHPSTKEFICIKLIQRLVSDEISLAALKAGTVPQDLQALLAACIAAWDSTSPKGEIREVLRVILDPVGKLGPFWSERAYRTKVKTPVEFINSTVRVLDGAAAGTLLAQKNKSMGMELFVRDDPDGWPELGSRWIDTASMLARMDFCQGLAENESGQLGWSTLQYLSQRGIDSAQEIVDYFDELMFQRTLKDFDKGRLLEFLTTDEAYGPLPLTPGSPDYQRRVQEFTGLLLSLPQWHFQ